MRAVPPAQVAFDCFFYIISPCYANFRAWTATATAAKNGAALTVAAATEWSSPVAQANAMSVVSVLVYLLLCRWVDGNLARPSVADAAEGGGSDRVPAATAADIEGNIESIAAGRLPPPLVAMPAGIDGRAAAGAPSGVPTSTSPLATLSSVTGV